MSKEISDKCLTFIKSWEKLCLVKYQDAGGKWTIGYGHLIKPGEKFPDNLAESTASDILLIDCAEAEKAVNDFVSVPLTQCQFDALVSLTFNIGRGNLNTSTLIKLLNKGNYEKAADEFWRWNKVKGETVNGLSKRRDKERKIFLTGIYEYTH